MLACHRAVLHPDRPGRISCVSDGHAHAAGLDLRDRDRECAYLHISLSLVTLTLYIFLLRRDELALVKHHYEFS